jgi:hypothetical protein
MKLNFRSKGTAIICTTILCCIQFNRTLAQDTSNVKEPPIPVYIISPFHEDSLRTAYEGSMRGNDSAYINTTKKLDTLQQQVQKSSAESTIHFIWLYTLVALLGIMNIVVLVLVSRIRKELSQMKHLEHQQMLLTSESAVMSQPPPQIQEPLTNQEPAKAQTPVRSRRPRTLKPRSKNRK